MSIALKGALFVILVACIAAIVLRRSRGAANDPEVSGIVTSEHGEAAALDALRKAGSDLSKRSSITYYLDFADGKSADRAADSVRALDFSPSVISGRDGVYACIASKRMILSQSSLSETTSKMKSLAESLGGRLDRWEVEVAQ